MSISIDTAIWQATIIEEHGNLCRLKHKPSGAEILRSPDSLERLASKPEVFGIPVLFPPNRIDMGRFTWKGQLYALPVNELEGGCHLHGMTVGKPWAVEGFGEDWATLSFNFKADPGFPHDFRLELTYRFDSDAVRQEMVVRNLSALPMPFGVGFHTAFVLPDDGAVEIATGGRWEVSWPRALPTGRLLPWERLLRLSNLKPVSCHLPMVDWVRNGKPFRGAVLVRPSDGVRILYEADSKYRHWCLWNSMGRKGFFCPEPMSCMVNAPNLPLPNETTGFQDIEPDQSWNASTSIKVESLWG